MKMTTSETAQTARLGMWARLGIVLSVLAAIIAPTAALFYVAEQNAKLSATMLELCQRAAERGNDAEGMSRCYEFSRYEIDAWSVWWSNFQATLVLICIAWLIALITRATIRWILAGRK